MFAQKLNVLFRQLSCTNQEIAAYAGYDRSNISRFRHGSRSLAPRSKAARKLVHAICRYAEQNDKLAPLCALIQEPDALGADALQAKVLAWLFEGDRQSQGETKGEALQFFAEKLDMLMKEAGLSNVRFSRLLNVDASLISRFRSGVRAPLDNPDMQAKMCRILLSRIDDKQKLLARMGEGVAALDEKALSAWLFSCDSSRGQLASSVEKILEKIDATLAPAAAAPCQLSSAPDDTGKSIYYGIEGLREAVLRFLFQAAQRGKELYLYSDQKMDWMTADPVFRGKLLHLLGACVQNGVFIHIIHNIGRNRAEMHDAIRCWLPLYMSGMIKSYYWAKDRADHFSNTIFLAPDVACVAGDLLVGSEENAIYHYYTDAEQLRLYCDTFRQMLLRTKTLIHISRDTPVESDHSVVVIRNALSLATMPRALAESFHDAGLFARWQQEQAFFMHCMAKGFYHEMLPLSTDEALFGGRTQVSYKAGRGAIAYSPEQYAQHIRNILVLLETYPNYRLYELPEVPFANIQMTIGSNSAHIRREQAPTITFHFNHPAMIRAFQSYADCLGRQYKKERSLLSTQLKTRFQ